MLEYRERQRCQARRRGVWLARADGKEEILERLVKLHNERAEKEKRDLIRWLRPEYQIPRFAPDAAPVTLELPDAVAVAAVEAPRPWPEKAVDQLATIGVLTNARPMTIDEVKGAFAGAKQELVQRHLETLALMGEVTVNADGRYGGARKAA